MATTISFDNSTSHVCWWCSEEPAKDEKLHRLPGPPEHEGQSIGWFCSYECGFAFLSNWQFPENYRTFLQSVYMEIYHEPLHRAPPPFLLEKFGGSMTTKEYREHCSHPLFDVPLANTDWSRSRFIEVMKKPYDDRMVYLERLSKKK